MSPGDFQALKFCGMRLWWTESKNIWNRHTRGDKCMTRYPGPMHS